MEKQYNDDREKRLNYITWVIFISSIVFCILSTPLALYMGVIEWNVRGVLLLSQR